eukprot:jgi/Chlat1/7010/Chrsp56S00526
MPSVALTAATLLPLTSPSPKPSSARRRESCISGWRGASRSSCNAEADGAAPSTSGGGGSAAGVSVRRSSKDVSFHQRGIVAGAGGSATSAATLMSEASPPTPSSSGDQAAAQAAGEALENQVVVEGFRPDGVAKWADVKGGAAPAEEQGENVRTAWEALLRWSHTWQNRSPPDHALNTTHKVVVFGGGSFGTAMAVMLARNKDTMDVVILLRDEKLCEDINKLHRNTRYLRDHELPSNVRATTDPVEALKDAQFAIHAVPAQATKSFLTSIAHHVPPTLPILSVSKGLEASTGMMMSQIIPAALKRPRQPLAVLSGPTFSSEMMAQMPTAIVAASKDAELSRRVQQLFASQYLRVNTSSDVVGVEMAGALKNVLAIASGIVAGMDLGNNAQAALVAQGCSEIRWLAEKMGAKPATLAGVSGVGDIMLTCFVNLSRNRSVGMRLGAGEALEDILKTSTQVAEGVATAGAVIALARKYRVSLPVLTAVARIVDGQLTPRQAMHELMNLPQVEER